MSLIVFYCLFIYFAIGALIIPILSGIMENENGWKVWIYCIFYPVTITFFLIFLILKVTVKAIYYLYDGLVKGFLWVFKK
jgi:hypothetical protein